MKSSLPMLAPSAICGLAVAAVLAAASSPARAEPLVAKDDVVLCLHLIDLDEFETHLKAHDKAGTDLYLTGASPPCMVLKAGDAVEPVDRSGERVQVVTRHGTPRFIGWGERLSFGD